MKTSQTLPVCALLGSLFLTAASTVEPVNFFGRPYRLASYNQKANAMWEFTAPNETVTNWTTLFTIVDRPDARTPPDLDRLAQGILDAYKAKGGKVLLAKTMKDSTGKPYNYIVVGFDQPAQKRFELNFVKAALGPKNAYMAIYGVRVTDPKDYVAKAKAFLNERSTEIGKELENKKVPALETLPRREF